MKILLIGGGGFIGSHIANELAKYHTVGIYDLENPHNLENFTKGDVLDYENLSNTVKDYDAVICLAGILGTHETVDKVYETAKVNILGAINIFEASKDKQVVYISKPNCWLNPYTITKIASESFGLMYNKEFGMPFKVIRFYNIFGPRQRTDIYQKAVPTFITRALKGEDIDIFGEGKQTTDHLYVKDAARATRLVLEKGIDGETYEVGSGEEISVNDIAESVIKEIGGNSKINHIKMRKGEDDFTRIKANIEKLQGLGFKPEYTFEQGLKETIEWYK